MDWTKIKTKHFLNSELTLIQKGALSTLFCLTAHLERMPTRREMLRQVPERCLNNLAEVLKDNCTTLAEVLDKVLEDVRKVSAKKIKSAERVANHRLNKKRNALQEQVCNATEKRREEKRREDNNNNKPKHEKFTEFSLEYKMSKKLFDKIKSFSPTFKERDLKKWAVHIDFMIRIDKRTYKQIEYLIDWLHSGKKQANFWKDKILSTSNLRDKFDQLVINAKKDFNNKNNSGGFTGEGIAELLREEGLA